MQDVSQAAQTIAQLLQSFTKNGALRLRYSVKLRSTKPAAGTGVESGVPSEEPSTLYVEFSGPDTPVLTARNGELLNALEHIATKILRLEPDSHDQVSFDADQFKANRDRRLQESAVAAIERVRTTGRPQPFPPMSSRERRMLHMILSESGLPTASSGEGRDRFVVLYPEGADISELTVQAPPRRRDANQVRQAFRPR